MKLGIIGFGKMGASIIRGVVKTGAVKSDDVYIYEINAETRIKIEQSGYNLCESVQSLYETVDMLIFAIKPQDFTDVLSSMKSGDNTAKTILTIAAGIPISLVKHYLTDKISVARVMPNTAAMIGMSASVVCFCPNCTQIQKEMFYKVLNGFGSVEEIDENQIDDVIPLSGSFLAYGYYFANAFIESAKKRGIDGELAKRLVFEAMRGTAEMALNTDKPISELISDVCSKGGTTIEGVKVFDERGLTDIVDEASIKCADRSRELGGVKK